MPITDQMRGLPMEDLIGGPLMASCKAQYMLAQTMVTFINEIGFTDGKTQTLDFDLERPVDDGTGDIKKQTVSVKAPLLGLVPIPALLIESVNINFTMEVKTSSSSKSSSSSQGTFNAKVGWGWFSASMSGSVSSQRENTRSTDNSAKYEVSVVARQQQPQEGMSKLMDLMASAVDPIAIKPSGGGA